MAGFVNRPWNDVWTGVANCSCVHESVNLEFIGKWASKWYSSKRINNSINQYIHYCILYMTKKHTWRPEDDPVTMTQCYTLRLLSADDVTIDHAMLNPVNNCASKQAISDLNSLYIGFIEVCIRGRLCKNAQLLQCTVCNVRFCVSPMIWVSNDLGRSIVTFIIPCRWDFAKHAGT